MPKKNETGAVAKETATKKTSGLVVASELADLGLENLEQEIQDMSRGIQLQPPRIRIEHSSSGRHRMFLDYGESYTEGNDDQIDIQGNVISGIVCYSQMIRAMWKEGDAFPQCSSVENNPTVTDPVHPSCIGCAENKIGGKCKPKVRLLLLTFVTGQPKLVVFPLSPTSIKRWKTHVSKLARSNAPYIAVITHFALEDVQKNSYRWAEVSMSVDRVVTKQELESAMQIRDQYVQQLGDVEEADFQDPGDKAPF